MFFTNVFSFASRARMVEHAYQATRADLRTSASEWAPVLQRHGLQLRREVLRDTSRTLAGGLNNGTRPKTRTTARLNQALDALDRKLPPDKVRKPRAAARKPAVRKTR